MARMRIIADAYRQLKADDPNTAITMSGLRRLVNTRAFAVIRVGRKNLINYDQLQVFLNSPATDAISEQQGQIRRVD